MLQPYLRDIGRFGVAGGRVRGGMLLPAMLALGVLAAVLLAVYLWTVKPAPDPNDPGDRDLALVPATPGAPGSTPAEMPGHATSTRQATRPPTVKDILKHATAGAQLPAGTGSHALLPDLDGDGLRNEQEDLNGDGVLGPPESRETDPLDADTDDDGWSDGMEVKYMLSDPRNPLDPGQIIDEDGDGLISLLDPNDQNVDSDGDRYTDGYEAVQLNPGAASNPQRFPGLGDVNDDSHVSNVDALVVQGVFMNVLPRDRFRMDRSDVNLDASVSNIDALVLQAFFMGSTPYLPAEER